MYLIGLDIGTTGCKASLFEGDGTLIAGVSREYAVDIPHPNWAEQDAEQVWVLAQEALKELIETSGCADVAAIGLSVQGEAVTLVDADGVALRPTMLGMDSRTSEQNRWLAEQLGAEWLFNHTGMPIHTINTLPKLLWIKEHEPEVWAGADKFLLYEDFIINKMTGSPAISRCLASRTQLYALKEGRWSAEVLEAIGLDAGRLAPIRPSGARVGEMRPALAKALGFATPPAIATGGHDQACGALGVGLVEPGLAMVSTGTAEVVEVACDTPVVNETLYHGNISIYEHTAAGLYVTMTLNHSGGLLLRWFRDTFGILEMEAAEKTGEDAYDVLLRGAMLEPTSLVVLPHFAGSGTPTFDTDSKGAILGLTFATTKTDVAKAILEGLTYELRLNLDLLKEGGVVIDELRAIGGGARSNLWLQLKADITGIPVVVPRITEAAGWGAALLGGIAVGHFADAVDAAKRTVQLDRRIEPDPDRAARYEEKYQIYRDVYPTIAPLSHRL